MRKKTLIALLVAFVLLFMLAIPLHLQKGLTWNDTFWRQIDLQTFRSGKNSIHFEETAHGTVFDVTLGGESLQLVMTQTDEGQYHFDSGEGWAIALSDSPYFAYSVGGVTYYMGEAPLIVTDAESPLYQFAPCHLETSYFHDESGKIVGEHIDLITESGYYLQSYETFYDHPESSTQLPEPILFETGLHITMQDAGNMLYVNAQGEYLTNAERLLLIKTGENTWHSKAGLTHFLVDVTQNKAARRGHMLAFVLYIFLYLFGLCMLKWPEQMAFLGSRWQYRYEPELSDAGLLSMQISAFLLIAAGVVLLFVPLFSIH